MADNNAPWYKQPVFWMLMSGPIIVVLAGFFTFGLAKTNADDMVNDDYYKEGKYINMQIERDAEAVKRHIAAQVLFNEESSKAKIFVSGDFDPAAPLQLQLMHPARKTLDQTVAMQAASAPPSGGKTEYLAQFDPLPPAAHWYVRVADSGGKWRVETKWLPSQGNAVDLRPADNVLVQGASAAP